MRLDKIVLNGFKSFADKTEFNIGTGITAIVGPNGCGKSNVVDAVKWVLGDQSPKSLRSGQMADVIFSGSGTRKPSGMSEVSLIFRDVNHPGIEHDELQVTRRLYRSGESEYLINQKSCRLKDIRELFMDTGVGMKAYSIIEQGQIDQLLRASRDDRRLIFEEAAGISKYKAHKKEALRKLERTEQNLLRLADILGEVQKQLRSVKLQAGKARNYLEYTERLKELRVNYSLAEYDTLVNQDQARRSELGRLEEGFGEIVSEVGKLDARLSELGSTIIEKENEINRCDNALVAAKSRIEQQLERIEYLRARIDELTRRKEHSGEQIHKLGIQIASFNEQIEQSNNDLEECEQRFEHKNIQVRELEQAIAEINRVCSGLHADIEDEKSGVIDSVRRTAQLHNEIESMNTYRRNLTGQKDRLSGKADETRRRLEDLLIERAQNQARFEDILGVLSELQETLQGKRDEMASVDSESAKVSEQLADLKETRSGIVGENNLLRDMENRREGLSSSIRGILERRDENQGDLSYIEGIVADIVNADVRYAAAVEAALEGKTDALVVNSTADFLADTDLAARLSSRVQVICADMLEPFVDTRDLSAHPGVLGRMAEFVRFETRYAELAWHLLGKTILVENLSTAMDLFGLYGSRYRYVTPEGQVFDGRDTLSIGPLGHSEGLISRKSRLYELEARIASLNIQIKQFEEQLGRNHQRTEHLEKTCKNLRTSIYEANTEKIDTESRLKLLDQDIMRLKQEQPLIAGEIETIETEINESVHREHETRKRLEEEEAVKEQRNAHIHELETGLAEQTRVRDTRINELTELRIQLGQVGEQKNSLRQKITSLQSQLQHSRMSVESARSELAAAEEQLAETHRGILSGQARVSELYMEKDTHEKQSRALHDEVEEMIEQRDNCQIRLRERRARQEESEQKIHAVQLQLNEVRVKTESLLERVTEELGIDLEKAYENYQQQEIDWEEVRQEIGDLRGKIERLGNVNVDAIGQQEELEQRFEFLSKQVEDLNQSKAQLEQLIQKINLESREKFRTTFEEVRANFQDLFRKLFGGGKADVVLENPEDLLECGIEIFAKPPGKQPRTISQLSGGEKTLTAIALQFAIFKCKPSPFCFLDEVDAALDEANNERFNLIVKEFEKDSQFVIITHSKRTMSIADLLFGVTMQTQGVSKKISVKFDEAEAAVA